MKKILAIDDDVDFLTVLQMTLEDTFIFKSVNENSMAEQMAVEFSPDLVICDVDMPNLNGFDILKIFQENPKLSHIPFIFLTGRSDEHSRRTGMNLGADDFLTKPFLPPVLIEAINIRLEKQKKIIRGISDSIKHTQDSILKVIPHEFRTPLNGVLGFSELLLEFNGDSEMEKKEMALHIHKSGERLMETLEKFITYFSIITNSIRRPSDVECSIDVIASVVDTLTEKYSQQNPIVFTRSNIFFPLSSDHLKIIATEIISNALKFSEKNSTIDVTVIGDERWSGFSVSNSGTGMSPDEIAAIGPFKQFQREKKEQQGLGLGLFIAKYYTELYSGTMEINSSPGNRTTVTIRFPK